MKITPSAVWRSWPFRLIIGVSLLGNAVSVYRAASNREDGATWGFPFPFFTSGSGEEPASFFVTGLLLDVLLPLTVALVIVWFVRLARDLGDDDS